MGRNISFTATPLLCQKLLKTAENIPPVISSDGAIILQLHDTWESLRSTRSAVPRIWPAHLDLGSAQTGIQSAAFGGQSHNCTAACTRIFSHLQQNANYVRM